MATPAPTPAPIPLDFEEYQVFMSIFKGERNARYEFKEAALTKMTMSAAGFSYTDRKKGSWRRFKPYGETCKKNYGNKSYTFHLHGILIDKDRQDFLMRDLGNLYRWTAKSFVLRTNQQPAEEEE
ncbi:hypothetical protein L227DRAFT_610515 [Lentinus tigrinus ALCF2SS1-6]|uniref:Uncharacterized protein n=1 Tax=Lentinus tigrinus ALCF2SS1-6 TaxID=1328759 RepID=A0A5C2SE93_9APHY|nr:hypothetical protein L227DRAFT_610515 [Lentinus tigrinus ALCF2SS1-6]